LYSGFQHLQIISLLNIQIIKIDLSQADTLLAFSKRTFYEFFAPLNDAANMEAYSASAFTMERMLRELADIDSDFYFAMLDDEISGYLKLNFNNAQTEFQEPDAMEIERIYVSNSHYRKGIGQQLMDFALGIARQKKSRYVWLGVWERNYNAIGFYHSHGFELFSSHQFVLGDDVQTDLLMKKMLV